MDSEEGILQINEGIVDRVLRVLIGVGLLSLVLVGPRTYWGFLGLPFIITGILGFCPVYAVFGLRTCRKPTDEHAHAA